MKIAVTLAMICVLVRGQGEKMGFAEMHPSREGFGERVIDWWEEVRRPDIEKKILEWSERPWNENERPDEFDTDWAFEEDGEEHGEFVPERGFWNEEHLDKYWDIMMGDEHHPDKFAMAMAAMKEDLEPRQPPMNNGLTPSYDVIMKDLKTLIKDIKGDITAADIELSHTLMTRPSRGLFEHHTWSWDSEIIVRGVINSLPMNAVRNAHAFHRPDPFDALNLLRSFFCHHYPCQAGYCALGQFYRDDVSYKSMYQIWEGPNGNFGNETSPITFLEGFISNDTIKDDILKFWSSILWFFEIVLREIEEFKSHPDDQFLTAALRRKPWIRCVCHEDFGGLYCESSCFKPPQ